MGVKFNPCLTAYGIIATDNVPSYGLGRAVCQETSNSPDKGCADLKNSLLPNARILLRAHGRQMLLERRYLEQHFASARRQIARKYEACTQYLLGKIEQANCYEYFTALTIQPQTKRQER